MTILIISKLIGVEENTLPNFENMFVLQV